jgi:hypothetical protein
MKNTFSPFAKLVAIVACGLTLGSCNRAEYAMLPKGGSYHGVTRVASPVPAERQSVATSAAPAPEEQVASAVAAPKPVAKAPAKAATPATTPAVATREVASATSESKATSADEAVAAAATAATLPQASQKLTRVQKFAASRLVSKLNKAQDITQFKKSLNTAETQKIGGYLRTGIILLLVGLIVGIFSNFIGGIIALIGLVFIVLWLLDTL